MAKIPRIFHSVFGDSADVSEVGAFGSFAAGSPVRTKNIATIMAAAGWAQGWFSALIGQNSPQTQDENAVDYVHSQQIGYCLQQGVPEWEAQTTYYTGAYCVYQGLVYTCIQDGNLNKNPVTQTAWWIPYDTTRTGVILAFSGLTVPFGYGLCDGGTDTRAGRAALFNANTLRPIGSTVNGSNIVTASDTTGFQSGFKLSGPGVPAGAFVGAIDSGTQFRIVNAAGAALNATATGVGVALVASPWGLGDGTTTFNRPDLRGQTVIGAGGGAFTARTIGQAMGEETHTLSAGEMPVHSHAVGDPGHAHFVPTGWSNLNSGVGAFTLANLQGGGGYAPYYGSNGGSGPVTNTGFTGIGLGNAGGGAAHNNMQPSAVCNYIIKY